MSDAMELIGTEPGDRRNQKPVEAEEGTVLPSSPAVACPPEDPTAARRLPPAVNVDQEKEREGGRENTAQVGFL